MILFLEFILVLSLFLPCHSALHAGQSKLITPEIDDHVRYVIQQWNLTGLAVAIVRRDTNSPTGWHREFGSYGIARQDGTPVSPDTMFAMASNSKQFTAMSTGLLIFNETLKRGHRIELSWSTKAKDAFGDIWGLMDEGMSRGVNIQDMLSHRTGMPRHDGSDIPRSAMDGELREKIRTLRYLRPSAELREIYQYNNLMYDALGYLPELFLNQSHSSYVDQHIFKPLNFSTTTYSVAKAEADRMAHGFQISGQDVKQGLNGTKSAIVPYSVRPSEETLSAGSGGIIASARDMATWVSALLNLGRHPYYSHQIIPTEVVECAATGVSVANGIGGFPEKSISVYGAGHTILSYRGHKLIEHGGNVLGFTSATTRLPDDNLGIVLLSNDWSSQFALDAIKLHLIDQIVVREATPNAPLIDWNGRYKDVQRAVDEANRVFTPRPKSSTAPLPNSLKGLYYHPTYGSLRPCPIPGSFSSPEVALEMMASMATRPCPEILKSLPVQRIINISDLSIHLYYCWQPGSNRYSNAGVRLKEGFASVDEEGRWIDNGDVIFPFQDFLVEWVKTEEEEGLAFKGDAWGMGAGAKGPSGTGKEGAEVWFSKVKA